MAQKVLGMANLQFAKKSGQRPTENARELRAHVGPCFLQFTREPSDLNREATFEAAVKIALDGSEVPAFHVLRCAPARRTYFRHSLME